MCGISGVISTHTINMLDIEKMNDKLFHRGPDGFGYVCTENNTHATQLSNLKYLKKQPELSIALAHRRLAIHDLSNTGQQPMSYKERYWIVFNGEIYNFIELRAELISAGYTFSSTTDTEVILAAYDYWGSACLNKFNGDWALVIIDTLLNKIFIARDRFGIKPLYYYQEKGLFVFASEMKAILAYKGIPKEANISYLKDYLTEGPKEYIKETAFKNIYHFDFASYYEGKLQDLLHEDLSTKKFWSLQPNIAHIDLHEDALKKYAEKYHALLQDAVKIRLRSDVKIGASLSGGLDSSSLVYLSQKDQSIETFSSIYQTPETNYCDESAHINYLVKTLNIKSKQIEPDTNAFITEHAKMIYFLESPPDSTLMSSWYTYKLENDSGIKVSLDGQGADEQLAGYLNYLLYYFANMSTPELLKNYSAFNQIPGARKYIWVGTLAHISKKIIGTQLTQKIYQLSQRKEQLFIPTAAKLYQSFTTYLINLLHHDDRASMAHSVEIRTPFLDYRLVEFLNTIPISYKLAKGWTKYLARYAFDKHLPNALTWRKDKLGWPVPDEFLLNHYKNWYENKIAQSNFIKQNFSQFLKSFSKASLPLKIKLLNLAVWHECFFN